MALFKKQQEEEWVIDDEEYLDEIEDEKPVQVKREKKSVNKSIHRNSSRTTQYEDFDDEEWLYDEMERKSKPVAKWKIVIPTICILILSLGLLGYFNTDFDNAGNPYIVGLEQHYERKYIKESDKVMKYLIEISNTLENDTEKLPSNYVEYSTKLKKEASTLEGMTTSLSKYVGVPTDMDTYHSQLLNFSLKAQEFIHTLLNNYTDVDYEAFREAGLTDYTNEFANLKQIRAQIDQMLFRNIAQAQGGK